MPWNNMTIQKSNSNDHSKENSIKYAKYPYILFDRIVSSSHDWFIKKNLGHILDDGRLDHHQPAQNHMAIYGPAGALRTNSSNSSSPGGAVLHNSSGNPSIGASSISGLAHGHGNPSSALLVVPQPINATKLGTSLNGPGTGRKYQCKMCPQVCFTLDIFHFIDIFWNSVIKYSLTCEKGKKNTFHVTRFHYRWIFNWIYRRKKNSTHSLR